MSRVRSHLASLAVGALALLVLVAGALGYSDVRSQATPIRWRSEPRRLTTTANLPATLTDEQLAGVLVKLRPRFRRGEVKVNHVDHALRCWGAGASFDDGQSLSGPAMRRLLIDHREFARVFGAESPPLMIATDGGVLVRVQKGPATASHVDHTLATLAETGAPAALPIRLADREARLTDLLDGAFSGFVPSQQEYEWTILAYLLFAEDPSRPFPAADGQIVTLDQLADRLMRQTADQGVCYGNHRLYALAILERLDREATENASRPWLAAETRERLRDHLRQTTSTLLGSQLPEGCWDSNGLAPGRSLEESARANEDKMTTQSGRILMTGHALEFWAMASPDLQPHREPVVRASQWLVREIDALSETDVRENYTYLSHACRALCLWRGEEPAESWRRLDPLGR